MLCRAVGCMEECGIYSSVVFLSVRPDRVVVPPVKLSTVGSRAFPVAAGKLWNNLPDSVTSELSASSQVLSRCYSVIAYTVTPLVVLAVVSHLGHFNILFIG